MDIVNKEHLTDAINFMLTRDREDSLYRSYAILLAHMQLYFSLYEKELTDEQQEEQKVRLYKIGKNILSFQKHIKLEGANVGPLLNKFITTGKPITEMIYVGEGDNVKVFDNVIAVVLTKNEERVLNKIALELKSLLFNI